MSQKQFCSKCGERLIFIVRDAQIGRLFNAENGAREREKVVYCPNRQWFDFIFDSGHEYYVTGEQI